MIFQKISVKVAIPLKHNIIFAKIIWKSFEFIFSDLLLKALSHQNVFKNALEKLNSPKF